MKKRNVATQAFAIIDQSTVPSYLGARDDDRKTKDKSFVRVAHYGPGKGSVRILFPKAVTSHLSEANRVLVGFDSESGTLALRPTNDDDHRGFKIGRSRSATNQSYLSASRLLRFIGLDSTHRGRLAAQIKDDAVLIDIKPLRRKAA